MQRTVSDIGQTMQAPDPVEFGDGNELPARRFLGAAEDVGAADVAADEGRPIGNPHHQRAIVVEQRDRAMRAKVHGGEKVADGVEPDRADGDAAEAAIRVGDSPAQRDNPLPGEVAAERCAHPKGGCPIIAMGREVDTVGEVGRIHLARASGGDDLTIGIQQHEIAEVAGRGGAIEKRQVPQPWLERHDAGHTAVVGDATQRQVQAFDGPADFLGDGACQVAGGLAGAVPIIPPGLEQIECNQAAKAHGDHQGESERMPSPNTPATICHRFLTPELRAPCSILAVS